jgi:hypothetical protein
LRLRSWLRFRLRHWLWLGFAVRAGDVMRIVIAIVSAFVDDVLGLLGDSCCLRSASIYGTSNHDLLLNDLEGWSC